MQNIDIFIVTIKSLESPCPVLARTVRVPLDPLERPASIDIVGPRAWSSGDRAVRRAPDREALLRHLFTLQPRLTFLTAAQPLGSSTDWLRTPVATRTVLWSETENFKCSQDTILFGWKRLRGTCPLTLKSATPLSCSASKAERLPPVLVRKAAPQERGRKRWPLRDNARRNSHCAPTTPASGTTTS
jgi:hypothetical protein